MLTMTETATPTAMALLAVDTLTLLANARAAVSRGAKLLDKAMPGWYRTGKLGKLATVTTHTVSALADFTVLKRQPRTQGFYFNRTELDGGYYGFYPSAEVAITGEPQTGRFDEDAFTMTTLTNIQQLDLHSMWRTEVRNRRQVENATRTAARIAKHGLAYEAARGRTRR